MGMKAKIKNVTNIEPQYRYLSEFVGRVGVVEKRVFENGNLKEYVLTFVNYQNPGLYLGSNADVLTVPAKYVEVI